jgi:hypothetical protein
MRFIFLILIMALCVPSSLWADSESYKAKVAQLLKDSNTETQMISMVTIMAKEFAPVIQKQMDEAIDKTVKDKKLNKSDEQKLRQYSNELVAGYFPYIQKALSKNMDKLYEASTNVYQKHFTEDELGQIIQVMHEPIMKKFAELAPTMMQENAAAIQPMITMIVGQSTKEYLLQATQILTGKKDI